MVHSWNLKKQILEVTPNDVSTLDSWHKCRDYITIKKPFFSKKLKNWSAQIMYKNIKSDKTTLFSYYYAKLLSNKNVKKWSKFELFTQKTTQELA